MDIKIEAIHHPNQEQLKTFYEEKLQRKYGSYNFIKNIDVKVEEGRNGVKRVALQIKPEKGTMLYANHEDQNENRALNQTIRKMNVQIEKYKEQHYRSNHKSKANNSPINNY